MLFSPTIGAAITAGYWFLRARCPACRTTGDVDLRTLDWNRGAAVTALMGHKNIMHTVRYTEMAPDRFKNFWKD